MVKPKGLNEFLNDFSLLMKKITYMEYMDKKLLLQAQNKEDNIETAYVNYLKIKCT